MDVVCYCRYSSEMQRDGYSIEAQLHAIREFCAAKDYNLINTYIDEARSGTNDDREGFQQMIADSADKTFSAVIIHKFDRFARDRHDSVVYKQILKKNGVRVISVTEPLDDSPESVILESVLEGMSEYYSKNLSRETKKGKRQAAREGKYTGGVLPLGFKVDENKRYVVVPEEARIVRMLFERLSLGHSIYSTAKWAQERGLRNKTGNLINVYFIRAMIRNTLYAGTLTYGRRAHGKTGLGEFTVDNVVEPIVDPAIFWDLFNKAQSRNTQTVNQQRDVDYILTGYAKCGICGSNLKGHSKRFKNIKGKNRSFRYEYYRCSGSIKNSRHDDPTYHSRCNLSLIRREKLEDFVIQEIETRFLRDDNLETLAQRVYDRLQERIGKSDKVLRDLEARLKDLKIKKDKLLDVYLEGSLDKDTFSKRNIDLSATYTLLSDDLKKAKTKKGGISIETIKKAIASMDVRSSTKSAADYKRQLLSAFVESIIVTNDDVTINYKIDLPSFIVPSGGDEGVCTTWGTNYIRSTTLL